MKLNRNVVWHVYKWFWGLEISKIANQNGRNMVQYILLPVNIHFHWNRFIFEFLTMFKMFILAAILNILRKWIFTGSKIYCTILRPFWFAMVAILNPKWSPKCKNLLIWAKFGFQVSFWIQNGHHSKPKWSQYGAVYLTPCKYPFPLKSFHFWIFNDV
jgi:Ulp1 family protease